MGLLAWMLMFLLPLVGYAQSVTELKAIDVTIQQDREFKFLNQDELDKLVEPDPERPQLPEKKKPEQLGRKSIFQKAAADFAAGRYKSVLTELDQLESKLVAKGYKNKAVLGLMAYWRGISASRLQDFPRAIKEFEQALSLAYAPRDIHYEFGQALFAAEKLQEARLQFRESVSRKFKRGVSLYYIAYISRELGETKKAVTFFKAMEKLPKEEAADVHQASETQIGDIYLQQAERHPDVFGMVESYVIPQYQKALSLDPDSNLAPVIREKIITLQRKYDLILFHLVNGRPTLQPLHFLRLSQETGLDTNVIFNPDETALDKSKQASIFSRTDFIGRYTFYYRNFLSIAPEFRTNFTRYFNREPEIMRNDNMLLAPAVRMAYEHTLWGRPASVLVDYEFSEARRDLNARGQLEFSNRSHTFMLGERFNYFSFGESILRLRYRTFDSFMQGSDSSTTSLVWEQLVPLATSTLVFFSSFDRTRVDNSSFDTNALSLRGDLIMPRLGNWFTPSFGLGLTATDPVNDRARRGLEMMVNPNARLAKTFGRRWRGTLKYDYMQNSSKDEQSFAFKKSQYSVELEYLF
jgi:tetratricopeptide (TPR) repeat protein